MPVGERGSEVEVRGFGDVAVSAQARAIGEVAAVLVLEQPGLPAEDLTRHLEEEQGVWQETREGDSGVRKPLLAADEVHVHERPVDP